MPSVGRERRNRDDITASGTNTPQAKKPSQPWTFHGVVSGDSMVVSWRIRSSDMVMLWRCGSGKWKVKRFSSS
eukprot:scaffold117683_cov46-Cyclotella_meneghiniana.AAC.4